MRIQLTYRKAVFRWFAKENAFIEFDVVKPFVFINGKLFIYERGGVIIIPQDRSYIRIINNSWYD